MNPETAVTCNRGHFNQIFFVVAQSLDIPKGMHFACHNTSSIYSKHRRMQARACIPGHCKGYESTMYTEKQGRASKYINPLMTKSAETILMKKSSQHWQQHYSIGLFKAKKNIYLKWKKVMLRKATKVHVYVQCFSLFFSKPETEDFLKFDTTAAYSYHWSIFS